MAADKSAVLSSVIEELVRFRTKVRHYALALPEAADAVPLQGAAGAEEHTQEQKERRKQLMRERKPLLEACDSLRGDLAAFGIHIKVEDSDPLCEVLSHFLRQHISLSFIPLEQLVALCPAPCVTAVASGGSQALVWLYCCLLFCSPSALCLHASH